MIQQKATTPKKAKGLCHKSHHNLQIKSQIAEKNPSIIGCKSSIMMFTDD